MRLCKMGYVCPPFFGNINSYTVNQLDHKQVSEEMTLEEYKETVRKLAELKSPTVFHNPTDSHASFVLTQIMESSKKVVRVYDNILGDLTDSDPEFLSAIRNSIERKIKVKYVYDEVKKESALYKMLDDFRANSEFCDCVDLRVSSDSFNQSISHVYGENLRFTLGDKRMYRIQPQPAGNVPVRKGICSFNGVDMVENLALCFDNHFEELAVG